jgi:hypothetical protein
VGSFRTAHGGVAAAAAAVALLEQSRDLTRTALGAPTLIEL